MMNKNLLHKDQYQISIKFEWNQNLTPYLTPKLL